MTPKKNVPVKPAAKTSNQELEGILGFAKGLTRAAGALALSYFGRASPTLRFDHDLVTEADLAVQDFIRNEVRQAYPDHQFLGEEGDERPAERSGPLWVVDPVDGTASFCVGLPVWGVSIALFVDERPALGTVFLPVTGELYSAIAGGTAQLNDRPIRVRNDPIDEESLLLTYSRFHSDFSTSFPGKVRSLGSTAAHLVYVARGAASGAVLGNVHVWDVAAGAIILEAAGGMLLGIDGKKVPLAASLSGERIGRILLACGRGQREDIAATLSPR
jgi:myo-inositol-1(or 4)-monophosphatase